jgi:hypothetical protein
MYIRLEEVRGTDMVLVIDEIGRYLGKCFFADIVDIMVDEEPLEELEYTYFKVSKPQLEKILK